jgi:hypothetical protein
MMTYQEPEGLAEELCEIIADLTSLEILLSENPEQLPDGVKQELKQEVANLRARLRSHLQ